MITVDFARIEKDITVKIIETWLSWKIITKVENVKLEWGVECRKLDGLWDIQGYGLWNIQKVIFCTNNMLRIEYGDKQGSRMTTTTFPLQRPENDQTLHLQIMRLSKWVPTLRNFQLSDFSIQVWSGIMLPLLV